MSHLNISIGNNNFRTIRQENVYYIDKTLFLEELLSTTPPRTSLITRPRRFGKTMMMSMLFDFFDITKDSNDLFKDLLISKNSDIYNKWINKYPTIYITLKDMDCRDFSTFIGRFAIYIRRIVAGHAYLIESPNVEKTDKDDLSNLLTHEYNVRILENSLETLCSALYYHYNKQVIVLIDEYDSPLNFAYKNGYYKECVDFIKSFFSPLKENSSINFSILTGCLRIAKESIFTGMNHFVCCDMFTDKYADKFGFTDFEIDKILNDAGFQDKKSQLQKWYDGYSIGSYSDIYCPWDVIQYIYALQTNPNTTPQLYWKNTSGNDIVRIAINKIENIAKEKIELLLSGKNIREELATQLTYDSLTENESNIWSLLHASGYLTKSLVNQKGNLTALKIPNKEVKEIFRTDVQYWFEQSMQERNLSSFVDNIYSGNIKQIEKEITDILYETISYYDYYEKYYHGFIAGILSGSGIHVISNTEKGLGRPDIIIEDRGKRQYIVIEIKRTRNKDKLESIAEKAIHQIKVKKYIERIPQSFTSVLAYGIAFWKKECVVKLLRCR